MHKKLLIACALLLLITTRAEAQRIRIIAKAGGQSSVVTNPDVSLTSPANSATSISINPTLIFTTSNTDTCVLNFGTSSPPTTNVATQTPCTNSFQPSTLDNNTQYFWSITVTNEAGSVTSSIRSFTTVVMGSASLLQVSDINPACKQFRTPYTNVANYTPGSGVFTYQIVAGNTRRWWNISGDGHVRSFLEPSGGSLSDCNTAIDSTVQATGAIDWGIPTYHGNESYIPNVGSTYVYGISWIESLQWLCSLWVATYGSVPATPNSISCSTLNEGAHTLTNVGCWSMADTPMPQRGSGIIETPIDFNNTYMSGNGKFLVGFGSQTTVGGGAVSGPVVKAINTPATNACSSGVNTPIDVVATLSLYGVNSTGPTCSEIGLGCTPVTAPTTPYAAQTQHKNYSAVSYTCVWDPYNNHGWYPCAAGANIAWVNTANRYGVPIVSVVVDGWANTTVLASPAPTISGLNVTFSVASTSTHASTNMRVGNVLMVQSCDPTDPMNPDCVLTNNNYLSVLIIDSVNTGTGAITAHIFEADAGNGDHKPFAGGVALFGSMYVHGKTPTSRFDLILQIINPSQYAAVINGDIQSYEVIYAEEAYLTTLITNFGCPTCTISGVLSDPIHYPNVFADNTNNKLMFSIDNASFLTVTSSMIYIFDLP